MHTAETPKRLVPHLRYRFIVSVTIAGLVPSTRVATAVPTATRNVSSNLLARRPATGTAALIRVSVEPLLYKVGLSMSYDIININITIYVYMYLLMKNNTLFPVFVFSSGRFFYFFPK